MNDIESESMPESKSFLDLGLTPSVGDEVVTLDLESTEGILVPRELLESRRPGIPGVILGYIPGHGGDVWRVDHFAEAQSVYTISELAPKQN